MSIWGSGTLASFNFNEGGLITQRPVARPVLAARHCSLKPICHIIPALAGPPLTPCAFHDDEMRADFLELCRAAVVIRPLKQHGSCLSYPSSPILLETKLRKSCKLDPPQFPWNVSFDSNSLMKNSLMPPKTETMATLVNFYILKI